MSMKNMPQWQEGEEFVNSFTHGIGAALSIVATYFLYRVAKKSKDGYKVFGNLIFGFSMILLYTASTLYHGLTDISFKKLMRYVDHCSVFILIAGSYAPFTLTILRSHGGYSILAIVWTIAIFGILSKIFFFDVIEKYTVFFYVAMGWVILGSLNNLLKAMDPKGVFWLALGGVTYTAGTYFFIHDETKFFHAIFHLFIIGGTLCHFIAAMFYC